MIKRFPLPGAHDINNSVTLHRWTGKAKELPGSDYILYALCPTCSQCLLSGMTKPERRLAHSILLVGDLTVCAACFVIHSFCEPSECSFCSGILNCNRKSEGGKSEKIGGSVEIGTVFIAREG